MIEKNRFSLKYKISIGLFLSYTIVIASLLFINHKVSQNLKETLLINEAKLIAETVIATANTHMHSPNITHIISSLSAIDEVNNLIIADEKTKIILSSNHNKLKGRSIFYEQNNIKPLLEKIDLTKRNSWLIDEKGVLYTSLFNAISKDKKTIQKLIFIIRLNGQKVTGFLNQSTQVLILSAIIGFIFAIVFTLLLFKSQIYRPIALLVKEIKQAHLNEKPEPLVYQSNDEFGYLINSFNKLMSDLFEKSQKLEQQKMLSEQAARSKSDFLAVMSHEIRTPLNGVIGMSSLLSESNLQGEKKQYSDTIMSSAKQLLSVINDILDFSKIDSGKLTLDLKKGNLNAILETTKGMFEATAKDSAIELVTKIEPAIKYNLLLDETRIKQVLVNLISNAFKFTEQGKVEVCVKVLEANDEYYKIRFSVIDTGIGLSQRHIDKLFSEFVQADTSTTRQYGGTGLGLAICKRLVELMGGDIWIESELGQGSRFIFDLPFEVSSIISEKEDKTQSTDISVTGKNILLVEDMLLNQQIAKAILKGNHIDIANDGVEAVEKVKNTTYQVILMDCLMPKMDGFTATKEIRKLGITTPIVALTASALQETKEKCKEAGMDDYLAKPFDKDEIHKILAKWL